MFFFFLLLFSRAIFASTPTAKTDSQHKWILVYYSSTTSRYPANIQVTAGQCPHSYLGKVIWLLLKKVTLWFLKSNLVSLQVTLLITFTSCWKHHHSLIELHHLAKLSDCDYIEWVFMLCCERTCRKYWQLWNVFSPVKNKNSNITHFEFQNTI